MADSDIDDDSPGTRPAHPMGPSPLVAHEVKRLQVARSRYKHQSNLVNLVNGSGVPFTQRERELVQPALERARQADEDARRVVPSGLWSMAFLPRGREVVERYATAVFDFKLVLDRVRARLDGFRRRFADSSEVLQVLAGGREHIYFPSSLTARVLTPHVIHRHLPHHLPRRARRSTSDRARVPPAQQ